MVVGPEFDGKMRWTLTYAGTTTGTSERMLQSNWNLVEGAAELARIDFAKAPRGVCLNRAPTVRVLGKTARRRGARSTRRTTEELHLFGSVDDEGLPRGARGWSIGVEGAEGTGHGRRSRTRAPHAHGDVHAPGSIRADALGDRLRIRSVASRHGHVK